MESGQLVTCVGGDLLFYKLAIFARPYCPLQGNVYTIENVIMNCPSCGQDHVTLEEISVPFQHGFPARWFKACRPSDFDRFMEQVLPPPFEVRFEG